MTLFFYQFWPHSNEPFIFAPHLLLLLISLFISCSSLIDSIASLPHSPPPPDPPLIVDPPPPPDPHNTKIRTRNHIDLVSVLLYHGDTIPFKWPIFSTLIKMDMG